MITIQTKKHEYTQGYSVSIYALKDGVRMYNPYALVALALHEPSAPNDIFVHWNESADQVNLDATRGQILCLQKALKIAEEMRRSLTKTTKKAAPAKKPLSGKP